MKNVFLLFDFIFIFDVGVLKRLFVKHSIQEWHINNRIYFMSASGSSFKMIRASLKVTELDLELQRKPWSYKTHTHCTIFSLVI